MDGEGLFLVWTGSAWEVVGEPRDVSDAVFSLVNDADPTKKATFSLAGISAGTTRSFTLPNTSSELAILAGTQTFTGNKTFSGTLTASGTVTTSGATATIGTSTGTATYGMGTGATTTGVTKTVNLGTGGASGSTTVVNIGSATAGAGGTTVINTPTVTFANAVTQVGMPQANLTAQLLGLGGATADSYNRVSVNTPAVLLNNAGAGIEATVNKAAAGNDAAFAFKTGFSARALIGLLGNDDFSFKVSPDGSAFLDAIRIDRTSGQVELPQPTVLPGLAAAPTPPPAGKAAIYARSRAGAPWIDVMRPSGRDFPLQPHFGVNRIANWAPSTGTTITSEGLPITSVGTVSHPTLAATNLAASMRRWRLTSAAVADSVADQRSAGWACWRGNALGFRTLILKEIYRTSSPGLRKIFSELRSDVLDKQKHRDGLHGQTAEKIRALADQQGLKWTQMKVADFTSDDLLLFRTRAEVLMASQFCDLPHRLRLSGYGVTLPAWLAICFADFVDPFIAERRFLDLWAARIENKAAPHYGPAEAWQHLMRIAGRKDGSVDMQRLRRRLGQTRPPVELTLPEYGLHGPIVGTIHASKGREASNVVLLLPNGAEFESIEDEKEETRVLFGDMGESW